MKVTIPAFLILLGLSSFGCGGRVKPPVESGGSKPTSSQEKLDPRIPKADSKRYISASKKWPNPNVFVALSGIYITALKHPREKVATVTKMKQVLVSLPLEAWPYGRVITLSLSGRIPGLITLSESGKTPRLLREQSEKSEVYDEARQTFARAETALKSLNLEIVYTPLN